MTQTQDAPPFKWAFDGHPTMEKWMRRFANQGCGLNMIEWSEFCNDMHGFITRAPAPVDHVKSPDTSPAHVKNQAENEQVDVESLKKKPEDFESHVPPNRQFMNLGWNDCINYLSTRGLLRTTPEDGKGDGWMPIETAPRDKVFCVWMPFGTMYTQCRWREDRGCAENHFGLLPEATHWTIPHGPTTQQPEHEGE